MLEELDEKLSSDLIVINYKIRLKKKQSLISHILLESENSKQELFLENKNNIIKANLISEIMRGKQHY